MDKLRRLLPVAILPLDAFAEAVTRACEEEISLTEPQLLQYDWLRILTMWSESNQGEIIQELSRLMLRAANAEETPYLSPAESATDVLLFMIGSVSLSSVGLTDRIAEIIGELKAQGIMESLRLITILDISNIPGQKEEIITKKDLEYLDKAFLEMDYPDFVYLVHNQSANGFRASRREDISEAIKLYIEGIILGNHWDGFASGWLNQRKNEDLGRFASFSVFSITSPQSELKKYLAHVSYNEVCERASIPVDLNPPIPQLSRSARDSETKPVAEGTAVKSEGGKGESTQKKPVPEQGKNYIDTVKPRLLENKRAYWNRVEVALANFRNLFSQKGSELHSNLVTASQQLIEGSNGNLASYVDDVTTLTTVTLKEKSFIYAIDQLSHRLLTQAEGIKPEEIPLTGELPIDLDVEQLLKPEVDQLFERAKRLPNPTSLLLLAALSMVLQVLFTYKLVNSWDINNALRLLIFWGGLILWVVLGVYLAWRLPAWRVGRTWKEFIQKKVNSLISGMEAHFKDLQSKLADHLYLRNRASEKDLLQTMGVKLDFARRCMMNFSREEKVQYPYPKINWDLVRTQISPFHKYLEDRDDIERIANELHKDPDDFSTALMGINDELYQLIMAEKYLELDDLLLREIRGLYANYTFTLPDNIIDRVQSAKMGWGGQQDQPLLSLISGQTHHMSLFYCACNQNIWNETLTRALQVDYTSAEVIDLIPQDRIFFFKTFYGIPLDHIIL